MSKTCFIISCHEHLNMFPSHVRRILSVLKTILIQMVINAYYITIFSLKVDIHCRLVSLQLSRKSLKQFTFMFHLHFKLYMFLPSMNLNTQFILEKNVSKSLLQEEVAVDYAQKPDVTLQWRMLRRSIFPRFGQLRKQWRVADANK